MASTAYVPATAVSVSLLLPLLLLFGIFVGTTSAAVYKVGDSAGWTTINAPNYTAWALSKTFYVGDTLLFEYNTQFHNVEQVNKTEYKSCGSNSPIKVYTSGNDSIVLKTPGRFFFLCGFPGHCQVGQKVDVLVQKSSGAAAPGRAPAAAAPAPVVGGGGGGGAGVSAPAGAAPSPLKNAAPGGVGAAAAVVTALAVAFVAGCLI